MSTSKDIIKSVMLVLDTVLKIFTGKQNLFSCSFIPLQKKGDKNFKMLGDQYGIPSGAISRWVTVTKYGHPVKNKQVKITKFTAYVQ